MIANMLFKTSQWTTFAGKTSDPLKRGTITAFRKVAFTKTKTLSFPAEFRWVYLSHKLTNCFLFIFTLFTQKITHTHTSWTCYQTTFQRNHRHYHYLPIGAVPEFCFKIPSSWVGLKLNLRTNTKHVCRLTLLIWLNGYEALAVVFLNDPLSNPIFMRSPSGQKTRGLSLDLNWSALECTKSCCRIWCGCYCRWLLLA